MSHDLIDLGKPPFWIIACIAVVLLAPIKKNQSKSWFFAVINLTFVASLIGWMEFLELLAGLLLGWTLVLALHHFTAKKIWIAISLSFAIGLFLLHKLPVLSQNIGIQPVNSILSIIAYSYVCLRLIDLFRAIWESRLPPPSIVEYINYLLPFHMMAAGPIQSYEDFVNQPGEPRHLSDSTVLDGLQRIAFGTFKKFVVATTVQKMFLTDFTAGGLYWILEAQMFFIWLYLDFSAYSDIASGLGKLIGVHTPENFNRPYLARNLTTFWERWHISLSMWIRRNLFYPCQMALVRKTSGKYPMWCASVALLVSFLICGIWHGIAWNFVVWGIMHATGLIAVNLYKWRLTKRIGSAGMKAYMANPWIRALSTALTFEWVALSHLTFFYRF